MDQLSQVPLTLALSKAGLSAGTTTTVSTTGTVNYAVQGKAYTKGTITNGATPTLDSTTGLAFIPIPVSYGACIVISLDTSGNVCAAQGQLQPLDASSGLFIASPQFPDVLNTQCPIGYITVLVASTAAGQWTMGASNLSGVTGVTFNFQDLITIPPRPQNS